VPRKLQVDRPLELANAALPVTTATSREEPTEATDPVARTIPGLLELR